MPAPRNWHPHCTWIPFQIKTNGQCYKNNLHIAHKFTHRMTNWLYPNIAHCLGAGVIGYNIKRKSNTLHWFLFICCHQLFLAESQSQPQPHSVNAPFECYQNAVKHSGETQYNNHWTHSQMPQCATHPQDCLGAARIVLHHNAPSSCPTRSSCPGQTGRTHESRALFHGAPMRLSKTSPFGRAVTHQFSGLSASVSKGNYLIVRNTLNNSNVASIFRT